MIRVESLKKKINGEIILQNVDFTIPKGEIVGLLGRNGAGKSTLIRTMIGILVADEGSVYFDEIDISNFPEKKDIAYVPDTPAFISQYDVKELVEFYSMIYPNFAQSEFYKLLNRYKLPCTRISELSKGMRSFLAIILAFCSRTAYVFLDEPTNGIDPITKRDVLNFIANQVAENGTTVLISTHHLDEVDEIATMIMTMKNQTIESIVNLQEANKQLIKLQVAFEDKLPFRLKELDYVQLVSHIGKVYTFLISGNKEKTLNKFKAASPLILTEIPISVEDIFMAELGGADDVV